MPNTPTTIDTSDREALFATICALRPYDRDLGGLIWGAMQADPPALYAIKDRFGEQKWPHIVEHLSDWYRQVMAKANDTARRFLILSDAINLARCDLTVTAGVQALDEAKRGLLASEVRDFKAFSEDNDPFQEHDFGRIELDGERFFFKFDYFDQALEFASPNPADPSLTRRVLTIMRADEY